MGPKPKYPPNRIKQLRKKARLTQQALADRIGASKSQLIKLERSDRELTHTWIDRLRGPLNAAPGDFFPRPEGVDTLTNRRVDIVGEVEAGIFTEIDEWDTADFGNIEAPVPEGYAGKRVFGLRVVGPSVNLKYTEGSIVVCVRLLDLGPDYKPEPGRFYVVYRRSEDGQQTEATIKQLQIDDSGQAWLWPRSSHPDYQQPWKVDGADGEVIELWGRVVGAWMPD